MDARRSRRGARRKASALGAACALALVAPAAGRATAAATPPATASSAPWRQTRFLLGGWGLGPAPSDPAKLLRLAAAGLDYVHDSDHTTEWPAQLRVARTLDSLRAGRAGFRLEPVLHRAGPPGDSARFTANPAPERSWAPIRRDLGAVGRPGRPATAAWFVWDEPCTRARLLAAAQLVRRLRADPATRGGAPLVNLMPAPRPRTEGCVQHYDDGPPDSVWVRYANDWLSAFDGDPWPAPCLSFDRYPFERHDRSDSGYFQNLRWARDLAARHSRPGWPVPVWIVIQISPYTTPEGVAQRAPTLAEIRWQAWCAVAYGARSVSYWMVCGARTQNRDEAFGPGLLDRAGRPTARYAALSALGRKLHAVGDALFPLRPVATLVAGAGDQVVDPDELLSRPGRPVHVVEQVLPGPGSLDCLIGCFRDPAGRADELLVVNRSLAAARTFRLRLGAPAGAVARFDPATRRFRAVGRATDVITLPALDPGDAVLVRLSRSAAR